MFALLDSTRIAQVIGNLLHNASKYTAVGGEICIDVRSDSGNATIRIIDPGAGIPASQLERVFDMFAKIERSVPDSNGGLGIGLALSRQLAVLHDGSLVAHSAGEGHGATFTLSLPLVDAVPTELAPEQTHRARGNAAKSLRIVVIEDNEDAAELLELWLNQMGHHVHVARNGLEGLALVSEVVPQVVLCDLGLPGISGLEVCERVRALSLPSQPVMVALTGWGMTEDRRRTQGVGFDYHLVKPVTADSLVKILSDEPPSV